MCSGLTAIPADLFKYKWARGRFRILFPQMLPDLTEIPAGLFDQQYSSYKISKVAFAIAPELTAIPAGLFDKNTAAANFEGCFNSCSNINRYSSRIV